MIIGKPLPFITTFIDTIDERIRQHNSTQGLSATQRAWLAFCLTAILVTNSICWARFERASLGTYSMAALSWMFRHSKIPWDRFLVMSVRVILRHDGLGEGTLVIDDTDNKRSKSAKTLAHLPKLRDKERGGYVWGQCLVFLVLVTPEITLPVGFAFYQPDPKLSHWYKTEKALKKQGMAKKQRPPKPPLNPNYPTKQELALRLIRQFQVEHPQLHVNCVSADALYGAGAFVNETSTCFGGVQVLSQIRGNQKIRWHKREQSVAGYLATHPGTPYTIRIRGGEEIVALISSARLYVCSHQTKRFVVALKYEGETNYRYLMASDMSWRTLDIVQGHTLGWLVELLFKEWKSHTNLHKFDTEKETIAESLIWASLAASAIKRFLAHAAEHLLEVVISTRKASMPSGYKLPDLFEALRDGDGPGYRRALEAMIRYLGKNAKRAHPKRDARTGCARLGLKPLFQVSEQQEVKDCEQPEAA